jgi:lipoyl-dependent peroxiredoxin
MKIIYTAEAIATHGREGHARTTGSELDLKLALPQDIAGGGTNPEELFACGYAACFGSAVEYVARRKQASVSEAGVKAQVSLARHDDGRFGLVVHLTVFLQVLSRADALAIVGAAHETCPYSRAIAGNVPVTINVVSEDGEDELIGKP